MVAEESLLLTYGFSGAFSNVYKALDLRTGQNVAGQSARLCCGFGVKEAHLIFSEGRPPI